MSDSYLKLELAAIESDYAAIERDYAEFYGQPNEDDSDSFTDALDDDGR